MNIPAWAKLLLIVIVLAVQFAPGVKHHWDTANDPYFVPFDATQYLPAFFKYQSKEPVPTTYLKEYYLNAICPPLYKALLALGAKLGDVRRFQLAMVYLVYAILVLIMGRLGWLLGGAPLCFAVAALTLNGWIFFGLGFIGGAPRMYGYPLIALALLALIRDRPILLALTAILGGLLYPIVGLIGGLCLAAWMLLSSMANRGITARWKLSRRLGILALTGTLTLASLVPLVLSGNVYGRRVVESDIATYPEVGSGGNYRPYDQLPYKLFGDEWISYYLGPLYSHGDPLLPALNIQDNFSSVGVLNIALLTGVVILIVILAGMRSALKDNQTGAGVRLASFFLVCIALHVIAWLAAPYLYIPARYFMFSLPFIMTLLFPWSMHGLLGRIPRLRSSEKLRTGVFLALIGFFLGAFGGRGNVDFAVSAVVEPGSRPVFDAIAKLPPEVVIAGWPHSEIRRLEYITRRNVFLSGDLHQVLHLDYLQAMRRRMDALFDAYFSTDAAPLYRLRNQFGVSHFLVDTRHFSLAENAPVYFAPWNEHIPARLAEIKGKEYLLSDSLQQTAAVFKRNGLVLLDLAKLP